jgi:hypothetical protein
MMSYGLLWPVVDALVSIIVVVERQSYSGVVSMIPKISDRAIHMCEVCVHYG